MKSKHNAQTNKETHICKAHLTMSLVWKAESLMLVRRCVNVMKMYTGALREVVEAAKGKHPHPDRQSALIVLVAYSPVEA